MHALAAAAAAAADTTSASAEGAAEEAATEAATKAAATVPQEMPATVAQKSFAAHRTFDGCSHRSGDAKRRHRSVLTNLRTHSFMDDANSTYCQGSFSLPPPSLPLCLSL